MIMNPPQISCFQGRFDAFHCVLFPETGNQTGEEPEHLRLLPVLVAAFELDRGVADLFLRRTSCVVLRRRPDHGAVDVTALSVRERKTMNAEEQVGYFYLSFIIFFTFVIFNLQLFLSILFLKKNKFSKVFCVCLVSHIGSG